MRTRHLPTVAQICARPGVRILPFAALLFVWACAETTGPELRDAQQVTVEPSSHHDGTFTLSTGIYRIPYSDGTGMSVGRDHHTHTPIDRFDLNAGQGTPIVAAASGWIRAIVDRHGEFPNAGDSVDINGVAQDDSLEHSCGNNDPANTVVGSCATYNNYVWIEHPNGEYTKYTHFGTGTVQLPPPAGFGWSVDQWIDAGQTIGLEGDVGQATSGDGVSPAFHLHFEVARASTPGTTLTWGQNGGGIQNGINLVAVICDIAGGLFLAGNGHTANPCDNDAPTANAGGPYVVAEGAPLVLDGTGSSDPDGNALTYKWTPAANLNDSTLAQPTFTGGDDGDVAMTLTVYDQIEALDATDNVTVTVTNVAPVVTIDPAQTTVIDEAGLVTVVAEFTDAGWLDTHDVAVDWGVPAGHEGTLLAAPTIQILDTGGPGTPLRGRIMATYEYGDNDAGAGYTIAVTVTDDDGAVGSDSFDLTVRNIDPAVSIDLAGAVLLNGVPTFVANAGEDVPFSSGTEDPGSDDLTLTWDWDDGSSDVRVSLVNAPAADPLPSPTMQPRDEDDAQSHTFAAACVYSVTFTADDDDDGSASQGVAVLIAGNADLARSSGYWSAEYRQTKNSDFTTGTLQCYLEIVAHASAVFSEVRPLTTFTDAAEVLKTNGSSSADEILDAQLLALWLNFANGAYALDDAVDSDGDGMTDTTLLDLLEDAEALRLHPNRTREELLAMKNVLEALNTM